MKAEKPAEAAPLEAIARPRWIHPERESIEHRIALNEAERLELIATIERDTLQIEKLHEAQRAKNRKNDFSDSKNTIDRIDWFEASRARAYGALSRNSAQSASLVPHLADILNFEERSNALPAA